MPKKIHEKRNVSVTVCLTKRQKTAVEELAAAWDIDMATIARRLIQLLLSKKTTLPELLEKYRAAHADGSPSRAYARTNSGSLRRKEYRVCIRLTQDEKQVLNILADEGFYLPGELAGILLELFVAGVIKKSDIWG
ncbi:MAG: hypothetical protein FWG82_06970 [Oscillospiraceae bacterium]|nr:hypothetical protein [Oscillospiraceae bacterium]